MESLAQRRLSYERLELRDQLGVPPASQLRVDPVLDHRPPQLVEPGRLPPEQTFVVGAVEGRAPPEGQCAAQGIGRRVDLARREGRPALRRLGLEATSIDLLVGHIEAVAARAGDKRIAEGPEGAAQLGHERLERVGAARGHVLAPELVGQALGLDGLASPNEKEQQERSLLRTPDGQVDVAINHLELAEHPEPHGRTLRPPTPARLGA